MIMKVRKYADGGKVMTSEKTPSMDNIGRAFKELTAGGKAAKAGDIANRARQLRDAPTQVSTGGGKVSDVKRYADGGKVEKTPSKPAPKAPSKGDTIQVQPKGSTADTLKNQRQRQMEALGLKNGGRVKKRRKR